jgi:hypothetical protein
MFQNSKLAPVNLVPALKPEPGYPRGLGQTPVPIVTPPVDIEKAKDLLETGKGAVVVGMLVSAGAAWVGYSTGVREKGLLSGLGWVVGVGASIAAIGGLSALTFADRLAQSLSPHPNPPMP